MNTFTVKTIPVPQYHQNRRADLMIDAGEFAIALSKVMPYLLAEEIGRDPDAEPAVISDRSINGLLAGLRVVGDMLSNEGSSMAAEAYRAALEGQS
jgi:hypothetical protein